MSENMFCKLSDLKNEATVESFFIDRLINHLGYEDSDVSLKESISEFTIGTGRKKVLYRPDYILKTQNVPTIVIDAKSPKENIDDWELQCSSYCLEINKEFDYNPVRYYVLSNGNETSVYQWDKKKPLLKINFNNFNNSSPELKQLEELISRTATKKIAHNLKDELDSKEFEFGPITLEELSGKFQKLHQEIWQSEKKGPAAAFHELIKIFFVKIRKDKELHERIGSNPKPKYKDLRFSVHWIATQTESENPINSSLFKNLLTELERDIISGKKKRFFDKNDQINLSSSTLRKIVKEIENIDLYGMEEDIHGRMFETFLDATIRGKDIGQFFTPRDIVELMVGIGQPSITKNNADKVLDACCGSGGFLISALSEMLKQASKLRGLSSAEAKHLDNIIKTKSIYGIDAGSDPSMYKIARMNMYLHGDGGSNIYYADSLDKTVGRIGGENLEVDKQIEELRSLILEEGLKFDLILSNPPFSLQYTRDNAEQRNILNQYKLSKDRSGGKLINKLISSVMFIERYKDLVSDNGKIVAVIDDSVLSGSSYAYVRDYIRDSFIIEGIISLPGDAFKRASARVKTSVIILRKKQQEDIQPDIFMASSIYLGLENKTAKRIGINVSKLPENKQIEKENIISEYKDFLNGKNSEYAIPFSNCSDRLDVKHCINDKGRKSPIWISKGYDVKELGKILKLVTEREIRVQDDMQYPLLLVNYEGEVGSGEILDGSESSYNKLFQVKEWDILISNMGFGRGAISVVPPFHSGKFVSSEYTILKAPSKECAVFYWNLLRTKEILGDVFSSTTGMNRGRIKWDIIKKVLVPNYTKNKEIENLTQEIEQFWAAYDRFTKSKIAHVTSVSNDLEVAGDDSYNRWLSFKPPE